MNGISIEAVFVNQLSGNAEILFMNCVG